jgi:hypothetical protein
MVRTCNVDIKEKADEMPMVEMPNAVVYPGTVVVFSTMRQRHQCNYDRSVGILRTHSEDTAALYTVSIEVRGEIWM